MKFILDPTPELLTFDCYGTLIDWDSSLRDYVGKLLLRKGSDLTVSTFYDRWYYQHALPMLSGPFKIYRALLKDSLRDALAGAGLDLNESDGDDFGDAMAHAEPFADTVEVLRRLSKRYRLGIISNSQDDIVSHAVDRMDNLFEFVITAETTRTYKPHPALFELILSRAGVPAERTVHIAQSQYVDLPRSVPMGMRTIWINRNSQTLNDGTPAPHAVLPNLEGLPDLLDA
ncbi:UNVERIFIED_ORG: 2-haloacid dehalogenase [Gordonia westfalica J30]